MKASPLRAGVIAGLAVGVLDITYACVFWGLKAGTPPGRIFQSVAAGVLGSAAFAGGAPAAALGLALHFFNALTIVAVYVLAARAWPALWRHPRLWGPIYGGAVYAVMNYVVVPLSAARPGSADPLWVGLSVAVHVLFVGMPSALAAQASYRQAPRP